MVEVGVRVDERDGGEAVPREGFEDAVGLAAGIQDDGRPGRGVGHDGAVAAERRDREGLDEDESHRARVCHTRVAARAYTPAR